MELEHVNAVLSMQIGAFVDEELMPHFGNLVNFVKHAEQVKNVAGIDAGMCMLYRDSRMECTYLISSVLHRF